MLKISYAGYPGLSYAISAEFTFEMCAAAENCQKHQNSIFLEVQGHWRSSMLTPLRSSSLVLVIIISISLPICNCFYA